MGRALLDHYESASVAAGATDIWTAPLIPTGQTWHVGKFGGGAVNDAIIALQWQTASGWETIRAVFGPGQGEVDINRDFVGDGTIRFRVVRIEKSTTAQEIVAWIEGYKVT